MCISCEMDDKWPPFIEFMIWFLLMGLNVGNHFGVWLVVKSDIIDITPPLYKNATLPNVTSELNETLATTIATSIMTNISTTVKTLTNETLVLDKTAEEQWEKLIEFRLMFLGFCGVGAALFFLHISALLPNLIQSFRVPDPLALKDSDSPYFSNVLKIHSLMLILESIFFDIPAGCLVMEMLSLIWEGPLGEAKNMEVTKMILTLSLIGLAFIALYKGMMPLFLWIGNPFCFPCIPLRLLVVFPGGLMALVMTFGPCMGVAKNRLLQFAPAVLQAEIGDLANTFFSIGMIFWGVFLIVMLMTACCWYKFCREGADADICSMCC